MRSKRAPKRSKHEGGIRKTVEKRVGEMKIGKRPEKKMSKWEEIRIMLYHLRVRAEMGKHALVERVVDCEEDNHKKKTHEAVLDLG